MQWAELGMDAGQEVLTEYFRQFGFMSNFTVWSSGGMRHDGNGILFLPCLAQGWWLM